MQQFPVAQEDVSAVFVQLTDAEKQGVFYDPLPAAIFAPDNNAAAVQAAINTLPSGQASILKGYAANVRKNKQATAISFDVSGAIVVTDCGPTSQTYVTGAASQAQASPTYTAEWKQVDGTFVSLNSVQIIKLNELVTTKIADYYRVESNCVAGIDGGTITTTDQIDQLFAAV